MFRKFLPLLFRPCRLYIDVVVYGMRKSQPQLCNGLLVLQLDFPHAGVDCMPQYAPLLLT